MPRFQVEVTVYQNGYIEFEAKDKDDAKRIARELAPEVHFGKLDQFAVDQSLFDNFAEIRVYNVALAEEEEEATAEVAG